MTSKKQITMEITEQLENILSEEAIKLLIGSDALKSITDKLHSAETSVKSLEKEVEQLEKQAEKKEIEYEKMLSDRDKEIFDISSKFNDLKWKTENLDDREAEIKAKEIEIAKIEIRNEYEKQRGDEMRGIVHDVFRNTLVRKTIFGDQAVAVAGQDEVKDQYGCTTQYSSPPRVETVPVHSNISEEHE